jgi:ATP adenylyltransferase
MTTCDPEMLVCRFCPEIHDLGNDEFHRLVTPHIESRIVRATSEFVVFPALGALAPGHLLIVPRLHCLAIGQLPSAFFPELESLMLETTRVLEQTYGSSCIVFEHGAVSSRAGCCVDHAHLHVVPADIDVRERLQAMYKEVVISQLEELAGFAERQLSYLFIQLPSGQRFAYEAPLVVSQLLRRLVADAIGVPERWDWAANLEPELLMRTLQDLIDWETTSRKGE